MAYLSSTPWPAFVLVAGLVSMALGEPRNWNPSGTGCVDPAGFLSCFDAVISHTSSRVLTCAKITEVGTSEYRSCIVAVNKWQYRDNISCWIQSCWNQVYSCEYQLTAIDYFAGSDLVQNGNVPFYPPPADASFGACSCNLGYVHGNLTVLAQNNCEIGGSKWQDCQCCQISTTTSNILNACPKTDLSILDFPNRLQQDQQSLHSPNNCLILDENPGSCASDFGISHYGDRFFNPLNLPAGEPGNDPLSNFAGNAFTETASNGIFTFEMAAGSATLITFAPFTSGAGVQTQSIDTSSILAATGGTGGSQQGSKTTAATIQNTKTGTAGSPTSSSGTAKVFMVCIIRVWFSTFFVLLLL